MIEYEKCLWKTFYAIKYDYLLFMLLLSRMFVMFLERTFLKHYGIDIMLSNQKYVAYYRVSTEKQGESGAGLDAQVAEVMRFTKGMGLIIQEFTEIESGANNERESLEMAIQYAIKHNAVLIVSKLDRISRDVAKIFEINSIVKFVACDMPNHDTLHLGMKGTFAQHEREIISLRTKKALQTRKDAGMILGKPENFTDAGRAKGRAKRSEKARNNPKNLHAYCVTMDLIKNGESYRTIAKRLNDFEFLTSRNKQFHPNSVRQLIEIMSKNQ